MPLIQFCTQSYKSLSLAISAQRALNLYAEKEPADTKTPVSLFGDPGIVTFATVGTATPVSLLHTMNDIAYGVAGNALYQINSDGTSVLLGSMDSPGLEISDNSEQLIVITTNKTGWVYQLQSITTLAATAVAGATQVQVNFTNSLFNWKNGDQLTINLDNGQTFGSTITGVSFSYILINPGLPSQASVGNLVDTSTITQSVNLIETALMGQTILYLSSANGFVVGDVASISLDSGQTFNSTITGVQPFTIVSFTNQLASQASDGNEIADKSPQFSKIFDPNFFPATTVTYFDDYFVLNKFGTNEFFYSALGDGFTYPALYLSSAQVDPDFVVGVLSDHEMLLIFGEKTIETWYDAGSPNNPFQRFDGATIQRGTIAPGTIIKEDNGVFFLGDDLKFYRLQGVNPIIQSTPAIEQQWFEYNKASPVTDAFTFSFSIGGHKFLYLTFPSAPATWVFDIATNLWHERTSFDDNGNQLQRWRGDCCTIAYSKILIGDLVSNKVGYIDVDTYTEFGAQITFEATSCAVRSNRKRVFQPVFELEMETGVGNTAAPNPQVFLSFSDDQGQTYSNTMPRQLGAAGVKTVRQRWLQLGQSRLRYYKATITDPVKRVLVAAYSDYFEGM